MRCDYTVKIDIMWKTLSNIQYLILPKNCLRTQLVSCPTRWSLYLPLALCIDHLSIQSTERRGTAMYYPTPTIYFFDAIFPVLVF